MRTKLRYLVTHHLMKASFKTCFNLRNFTFNNQRITISASIRNNSCVNYITDKNNNDINSNNSNGNNNDNDKLFCSNKSSHSHIFYKNVFLKILKQLCCRQRPAARGTSAGVFLWISLKFLKHIFYRVTPDDEFCSKEPED